MTGWPLSSGARRALSGHARGGRSQPSGAPPRRPNIVLVLTDDLDAASWDAMPTVRTRLVEEDTVFLNGYPDRDTVSRLRRVP